MKAIDDKRARRAPFRMSAGRRFSRYLQTARIRAAMPYLQGRVLDVGCDTAVLSSLLPKDASYAGVDSNPEVIRTAKEVHPELELYCADVESAEAPTANQFDTLVALAVFEHLERPHEFLKRYAPLLGKGSHIVLTTPTPLGERLHRALQRIGITSSACSELHHHIYRARQIADTLKPYGFDIVVSRRFEIGMNRLVVGRKRMD